MKKALLLTAVLTCTGAVAQEKEIWACQGTDTNGFIFRSGSWEKVFYTSQDFTLTLTATSAGLYSYTAIINNLASDNIDVMFCNQQEEQSNFVGFLHCNLPSGDPNNLSLNKITGKAVRSDTLSYFDKVVDEGASIYLSLYQCTKF